MKPLRGLLVIAVEVRVCWRERVDSPAHRLEMLRCVDDISRRS